MGNPQGAVVVADSVTIGGSLRLLLEVFLCFFCLLAGTMPHASAMRRFPVSDATRLVDSDLESGEIPDSDLESDNGSDLSSLTVAALGNAIFGSLASRMAGRASDPVEGGMICKTDQGCVYPEDVMSCKRCACIYYVVLVCCCLRVNIIDFMGHLLLSQIRRGGFRRRLLLRRKSGHRVLLPMRNGRGSAPCRQQNMIITMLEPTS